MRTLDLVGKRFGKLLVLMEEEGRRWGQVYWRCLCECGEETTVAGSLLAKGHTTSCGCRRREVAAAKATTHGGARWPEYRIWSEMIQRCSNPKSNRYSSYGARGIKVCERWKRFENFIEDMGRRPPIPEGRKRSPISLERRDNNGNYEPGNCYWATLDQQGSNRRNNRKLCVGGVTKTMEQWCREKDLNPSTVCERLKRGDTPERALRPV